MDIELYFSYSAAWLLLTTAVAAGLTWLMYRRMPADWPRWLRRTLPALRFAAIWLAFLLLLEPVLTAISEEKYPPLVVLLHDDSESIPASKDSSFVRRDYPALVHALSDKLRDKGAQVVHYRFGTEAIPVSTPDSLTHKAQGTDIGGVLQQVAGRYASQNLGAVVLLSDGIQTGGRSPRTAAEQLKAPLFTVLLGDTTAPKDLQIEAIFHNETSYLEAETPVMVQVRQHGYGNIPVEVTLLKNGNRVAGAVTQLSDNEPAKQVEFNLKMTEPSIQAWDVVITRKDGEISYLNNQQRFFIDVRDNRFRVVILAGAPHPDIGALKQLFRLSKRFEVTEYVRRDAGSFFTDPAAADFGKADLFILHSYPTLPADNNVLERVYAEVSRRHTPLLHILGTHTRFGVHTRQAEFTGVAPRKPAPTLAEAFLYLDPAYRNHSTYRTEDASGFNDWLQTAPPLLRLETEWNLQAGAQAYGKARIKSVALDYPLLVLQEHDGRKAVTFTAEGLWRLRVHNFSQSGHFEHFDNWILNLIDWLATVEKGQRFRVYPTRRALSGEERVVFRGEAYDDSNKPVKGAEIRLAIKDEKGQQTDYFLQEDPPATYGLSIDNLAPGVYTYVASGKQGAQALGTDNGAFTLGRSAIEYRNLRADEPLMRQLALQTDGAFFYSKQLDRLADKILASPTLQPMAELRRSSRSLHRYWLPLLCILALLSTEWILRKRQGQV
ncbi:MAG: VWA domain-containing protein [Bacteroidetes bacterium]|nr:VWA domain-containing protein [Bacteroidota bacterium]